MIKKNDALITWPPFFHIILNVVKRWGFALKITGLEFGCLDNYHKPDKTDVSKPVEREGFWVYKLNPLVPHGLNLNDFT